MMGCAARQPGGRISEVFDTAAGRQGAYDLVEHDGVSLDAVQRAVGGATARASAGQPRVVVALDGTSLSLTDRQHSKDFGQLGIHAYKGRGIKVMNSLAMTEQGQVLGVAAQRYWVRSKPAQKKGYRRVSERESTYWRDVVTDVSQTFARLAPTTQLHFIADREADAALMMKHILRSGHDFTIRANGTRKLLRGRRRVSLRKSVAQQPPLGCMSLTLRRSGRDERVDLTLRAVRAAIVLRDRHTQTRTTHELTIVWARQPRESARGREPIQWLLYTTDEVHDLAGACAVVERYAYRWRIEEMHRTWKSGACNVESMQLRSFDAATKWASMLAAVAARIERLKTLSREQPDEPAVVELSGTEIAALKLLKRKQAKRTEVIADGTPTIGQAVRWIADLGGYVGHKSSGPPGSTVIGRGLEKLATATALLQALQEQGALKMR